MNAAAPAGGNSFVLDRLQGVSVPARKLFAVVVQQARHGPIRPKPEGTATPAEILEACGLDVGEFYDLLNELKTAGLIRVSNVYPFEEIQLSPEAASEPSQANPVTWSQFPVLADQRLFEDYIAGSVYEFGSITVTESEIIEFAKRFDPQFFHVDPVKAVGSHFGGLIASGWHTIGLAMRLLVDHFLPHVASLGSPGVDEIRWPNPVRAGDTLRIRVTILEARPSRSKPDRGIVRTRTEALNQRDELVLTMIAVSLLGRRHEPR
jgi:acyl dehydratase